MVPAPDAEHLAFLERNIGRFKAGDDMAAVIVSHVPDEYRELAVQAADECPVGAIVVE